MSEALILSEDRVEPWSYPVPHLTEHAQVWHARRFTHWLLRAGAEPRLGHLLASGPTAIARWALLLEEQGVEIAHVQTTLDRPLPRPLTEHRGDHFNRKLFFIEGFDQLTLDATPEERAQYWNTLEGQRGQLKKGAMWVALLMTRADTLSDALRWAPRLMESITRVCWMWEPREATPRHLDTSDRDLERRAEVFSALSTPHRFIYHLFRAASLSHERIDHLTLGRIFRCGYPAPPPQADERWRWAYRLWRGDARDPRAARFGQVGVTEALSESVSPDDALWALCGRSAAASPARLEQWFERAQSAIGAWRIDPLASFPESFGLSSSILKALNQLKDWSRSEEELEIPLTALELRALEVELRDWVTISASLPINSSQERWRLYGQSVGWLTRAFAAHDDLEGCIRVNDTLGEERDAWPELRFEAYERSLELALFVQDHAKARRLVEALESLDLEISSPYFEARSLHARARQLGALDPARGVWEREEAEQIEARFGWSKS